MKIMAMALLGLWTFWQLTLLPRTDLPGTFWLWIFRVATVREKYLENEFFSRSGNFVVGQGNLEKTWKVREKSGNLKINGYGRETSENLFNLFKRGKRLCWPLLACLYKCTRRAIIALPQAWALVLH